MQTAHKKKARTKMTQKPYENAERIARLETMVENIRDNHLHSIESKIDKIENRIWWVMGTIVVSMVLSNLGSIGGLL
jgi:type II secretory pathway component PulF